MNETEIFRQLQQADLFEAFCIQLKKDFESAGLSDGFGEKIPSDFVKLKNRLTGAVEEALRDSPKLGRLLNRIDISEKLLGKYVNTSPHLFAETLSELIIKRILQKV